MNFFCLLPNCVNPTKTAYRSCLQLPTDKPIQGVIFIVIDYCAKYSLNFIQLRFPPQGYFLPFNVQYIGQSAVCYNLVQR